MSNNGPTRRNATNRVRWIVRTTLITLLLLTLALAVTAAGYWGIVQVQRSFDRLVVRGNAHERALADLRAEVERLTRENEAQQRELTALQAARRDDLATLGTQLAQQQQAWTTAVARLSQRHDDQAAESGALRAGLTAMQSDLITNTAQLDQLGGELDGVRAALAIVTTRLGELEAVAESSVQQAETAVAATETMTLTLRNAKETLLLFQTWELMTRARLRLLENNLGLATTDIRLAEQTLSQLSEAIPANSEEAEVLAQIITRLQQALVSLTVSANGAAQDLDRAWDELEQMINGRIRP